MSPKGDEHRRCPARRRAPDGIGRDVAEWASSSARIWARFPAAVRRWFAGIVLALVSAVFGAAVGEQCRAPLLPAGPAALEADPVDILAGGKPVPRPTPPPEKPKRPGSKPNPRPKPNPNPVPVETDADAETVPGAAQQRGHRHINCQPGPNPPDPVLCPRDAARARERGEW